MSSSSLTQRARRARPARSTWILAAALGLTLAACSKPVPSPWKELGVPSDGLKEVRPGTPDQFYGSYDDDAHRVVAAFRAGLVAGGLKPCGEPVRKPRVTTAYYLQAEKLWKLRVTQLDDESSAMLTVFDPKQGYGHEYPESGCKASREP